MDLTKSKHEDVIIIRLIGRIDTPGGVKLNQELRNILLTEDIKVILDMEQVSYINSAALRFLADTLIAIQAKGGNLYLAALNPKLARIVEIVGFDAYFKSFANVQAALDNFS